MVPSAFTSETVLLRRQLTPAEAACLHEELRSTPNILGYMPGELLRFTDVLVAEVSSGGGITGDFAGACLSKDLLFGWTDISVLYVLPAFRSRGISSLLFTAAFANARKRNRHIYTLSRSPQVIHLMERLGMQITSAVWKAPFAVHWETQWHLSSWYRFREAIRKMEMRKADGYSFVAGTKRSRREPAFP